MREDPRRNEAAWQRTATQILAAARKSRAQTGIVEGELATRPEEAATLQYKKQKETKA